MTVQLALQAQALGESGYHVRGEGGVFHSASRQRAGSGRSRRTRTSQAPRRRPTKLLAGDRAPEPLEDTPRCRWCSHAGVCLPNERTLGPVRRQVLAADARQPGHAPSHLGQAHGPQRRPRPHLRPRPPRQQLAQASGIRRPSAAYHQRWAARHMNSANPGPARRRADTLRDKNSKSIPREQRRHPETRRSRTSAGQGSRESTKAARQTPNNRNSVAAPDRAALHRGSYALISIGPRSWPVAAMIGRPFIEALWGS